jgi:poly-gamma-glutamate synthesis protein (capsule biosynthesis protein)
VSEIGSPANYIFTFDPSWVETLYDHNIRLVTIGNNHMFNFGRDGLEQTQKYLEEGKVEYFGDLTDFETISTAVEVEGMLIGFVSYNQFSGGDEEHAVQEIRRLKTRQTVDVVIVYTHWGSEYATGSNAFQRAAAHEFIDAGADLVIGSHPHVVQEMEEYNGKRIYYSLGNFVFDQYFSQETMEGLMVRVTINPQTGEFGFQEQKVSLRNDGKTKVQDQ